MNVIMELRLFDGRSVRIGEPYVFDEEITKIVEDRNSWFVCEAKTRALGKVNKNRVMWVRYAKEVTSESSAL